MREHLNLVSRRKKLPAEAEGTLPWPVFERLLGEFVWWLLVDLPVRLGKGPWIIVD